MNIWFCCKVLKPLHFRTKIIQLLRIGHKLSSTTVPQTIPLPTERRESQLFIAERIVWNGRVFYGPVPISKKWKSEKIHLIAQWAFDFVANCWNPRIFGPKSPKNFASVINSVRARSPNRYQIRWKQRITVSYRQNIFSDGHVFDGPCSWNIIPEPDKKMENFATNFAHGACYFDYATLW